MFWMLYFPIEIVYFYLSVFGWSLIVGSRELKDDYCPPWLILRTLPINMVLIGGIYWLLAEMLLVILWLSSKNLKNRKAFMFV